MQLKNPGKWYNFWLERRGVTFVSCRFAELVGNSVEVLMDDDYPFDNAVQRGVDYIMKTQGENLTDKMMLMNVRDRDQQLVILGKAWEILEEVWAYGEGLKEWRLRNGDPQISFASLGSELGGVSEEHKEGLPKHEGGSDSSGGDLP